ncbi:protein TIFY 8 isoform X2 [Impatiens glandulifera]|nr:protein TIFY 8 isoform X2 [Impatiens glandulifera]
MAQSKDNAKNAKQAVNPAIFHDFLGRKCASDASPSPAKAAVVVVSTGGDGRFTDASPSASLSAGGRGLVSVTSEGQVSNHFEGVPFYGLRSDPLGHDISKRFVRNKRSNSDSGFITSSGDGFQQRGGLDSVDSSHLIKMLRRTGGGGEWPRQTLDEPFFSGMHHHHHPWRSAGPSVVLQAPPLAGNRSLNIGHHPHVMGQITSLGCQPSVISTTPDEGSRTGIKGSQFLLMGVGASKQLQHKSNTSEPEAANSSVPTTSTSQQQHQHPVSGQMTIFYGGEAHVFDDVHPHKADIIMALAGSNGGSWSTTTYNASSSSKKAILTPAAESGNEMK